MKHYLKNNEIFAFENDGSQDHLITEDMVALSDKELAELRKPTAEQSAEQARQEALITIAQLEASQLRSIRELMLDANNQYAKAKLVEIEAKIQEERAKL